MWYSALAIYRAVNKVPGVSRVPGISRVLHFLLFLLPTAFFILELFEDRSENLPIPRTIHLSILKKVWIECLSATLRKIAVHTNNNFQY